jgi:hypothetical protein
MDGTGQKVSKRLDVFSDLLEPLSSEKILLLKLAVDWRNRRVHSLADDQFDNESEATLRTHAETLRENNSGLVIDDLIKHYRAGDAPTFKEAASVVRVCHDAVSHFDACLLSRLDIERYVTEAICVTLAQGRTDSHLRASCIRIWGSEKKDAKVLRTLRFVGVHESKEVKGRRVPDEFIEMLLQMSPTEAADYFCEYDSAAAKQAATGSPV